MNLVIFVTILFLTFCKLLKIFDTVIEPQCAQDVMRSCLTADDEVMVNMEDVIGVIDWPQDHGSTFSHANTLILSLST